MAKRDVESLVVQLETRLNTYEREMKKAVAKTNAAAGQIERRFDRMAGNINAKVTRALGPVNAVGGKLIGTLTAITGAAGVLSFAGAISGAMSLADSLKNTSTQVNLTIEQLQALNYAAADVGIKSDEVASAMVRFNTVVGDAVTGNKAAEQYFRALGISLRDTAGNVRPVGELLEEVARKITGLRDPSQRAAAAADLFGKSGVKLVPVLNDLSGGFDELTKKADDAGQVMSTETVVALEAAGREIDKLKNRIVIAAGEIAAAINRLASGPETLADINEQIRKIRDSGLADDPMGAASLKMLEARRAVLTDILRLSREGGAAPTTGGDSYSPTGDGGGGGGGKATAEDRAAEARKQALIDLAREIDLNTDLIAVYGQGEKTLAAMKAAYDALAESRRLGFEPGSNEEEQFLADSARLEYQRQQLELMKEGAEVTAALRTEEEMRNAELERLNALLEAGAISSETYDRALLNLAEKYDQQSELMERLGAVGERAFDRIGGAITEAFAKGEISALDFEQIVNAVLAEILQEMIRVAILNPLGAMLMGGAGGGGGLLGALIGGIGSLFGGGGGPSYASMAGRGVASGGPVSAGRAYTVGETGRELFVPSEGGTVIPHRALMDMVKPQAAIIPALAQAKGGEGGRGDVTVNITTDPDLRVRESRSQDSQGQTIDITVDRIVGEKLRQPGTASNRAVRQMGARAPLPRL